MRVILSRTDSIGDVVLTLPMAAALKETFSDCTVIFLGREYTRPVVERCHWVDEFVAWNEADMLPESLRGDEMLKGLKADVILHVFPVKEICHAAKRAGIPIRIATAGRFFTLFTCNRLLRIPRRNSDLHEAQLNLRMLKALGISRHFTMEEIAGMYGLSAGPPPALPVAGGAALSARKLVILHPKSKGSAREWGLENFSALIGLLPPDQFSIVISGTREEGEMMTGFLEQHRNRVTDLTGKVSLGEFIALIGSAEALVAASTGPLHIAAALGIRAIGLYAPMRPIFPQRWAPVGKQATFLVLDKPCNDCRKTMNCHCIRSITPEAVKMRLTGG